MMVGRSLNAQHIREEYLCQGMTVEQVERFIEKIRDDGNLSPHEFSSHSEHH